MTVRAPGQSAALNDPLATLRATPEERARVLSAGQPFDVAAWLENEIPASADEVAELDEFLRDREEMRRQNLEALEERLAGLAE